MFGYIYKTTNLINGHIYIGKKQKAKFDHNYYGSGKIITSAINKYGKENFSVEVLEWCENKEHLNERECYWIKKFKSQDLKIGYNISAGGDGFNSKHTDSTKKRIGEKNRGKPSPIKDKIAIYNKVLDEVIYINSSELDDYKDLGWIKFNPKAKKPNFTLMMDHNGNNKQIPNSNVDQYLEIGYSLGRNYESNKGRKQTIEWITRRISKTTIKLKNKKHINNGKENKYVDKDELEFYLSQGWVLGELPKNKNGLLGKSSKNRIWVNNSKICKFILTDDLNKYLNDGWAKGRIGWKNK